MFNVEKISNIEKPRKLWVGCSGLVTVIPLNDRVEDLDLICGVHPEIPEVRLKRQVVG